MISEFSMTRSTVARVADASAELLLLSPLDATSFELVAADTLEMRHTRVANSKRFFLCSLPTEARYFLLGQSELIAVSSGGRRPARL